MIAVKALKQISTGEMAQLIEEMMSKDAIPNNNDHFASKSPNPR
jgi:hypothetical protein